MADADSVLSHPPSSRDAGVATDGQTNTPRAFSVSLSKEEEAEICSHPGVRKRRRSRHDSQDSHDTPLYSQKDTENPSQEGNERSSQEEQESSGKEEDKKSDLGKLLHSDPESQEEPRPSSRDEQGSSQADQQASQKNEVEKNSERGDFSPDEQQTGEQQAGEQQTDVAEQKKLESYEDKDLMLPRVVIQKSSSEDLDITGQFDVKEQPLQQKEGEEVKQQQCHQEQSPGQAEQQETVAQVQQSSELGGRQASGPLEQQSQGHPWTICIAIAAIAFGLFGIYCITEDFGAVDVHVLEQLAEAWRPNNCVNLLVTGRATTGKHELVHTLLGVKPKCATTSLQRVPVCEANVQGTCFKVTFWTLPDVNDWNAMEKQLRTLDLIIYTLRMDDTRLRPEDISNLYTLSKEFGDTLWTKGMFALTFANKVTYLDHEHRVRRSRDFSLHRRNELKQRIRDILASANVLDDVSRNIPFVPTGHHSEGLLFDDDGEPWINQFTKCAIVKMHSGSNGGSAASGALWKAAKHHLKLDSDMTVVVCPQLQ